MLKEILAYLNPKSGENYIDCTLGGAGYTLEIAKRIGSEGKILSIDLDQTAIANAVEKIQQNKYKNIILANDNFKNLSAIIKKNFANNKTTKFAGIVFDLGLSSAQLQDQSRGFSFQLVNAPLNMAFGQNTKESAESIINEYSENELTRIFKDYGEEKNAWQIAKQIIKTRREMPIKTVDQLLVIINKTVDQNRRALKIHPATKIFQALRIAVNDELENLKKVLPQAISALAVNGKIAIVAFHSLEDRIVKQFFKQESRSCVCSPICPACQCNHQAQLQILTPKVIKPTEKEILDNPRSRSAKLRIAKKI